MDLGTILGLVVGLVVILLGIVFGGESPVIFIDAASFLITILGSMCAVMVSLGIARLMGAPKIAKNAIKTESHSPQKLIADLVNYAEVARRNGILSLESMTDQIEDEFIVKGIQMAVDGTDPELIEQIMTSELDAISDRHGKGRQVFELLGKYAPAFGMIGTLVGLVIMLRNLGSDVSKIGGAMAVAMITTLYGAIAANLVFMPIADKLKGKDDEERFMKEIIIKGVMSIQSGDNPRVVEQRLKTFLPPSQRDAIGEGGEGGGESKQAA